MNPFKKLFGGLGDMVGGLFSSGPGQIAGNLFGLGAASFLASRLGGKSSSGMAQQQYGAYNAELERRAKAYMEAMDRLLVRQKDRMAQELSQRGVVQSTEYTRNLTDLEMGHQASVSQAIANMYSQGLGALPGLQQGELSAKMYEDKRNSDTAASIFKIFSGGGGDLFGSGGLFGSGPSGGSRVSSNSSYDPSSTLLSGWTGQGGTSTVIRTGA